MGILSFDAAPGKAEGAMEIIDREFVDLNELRVATELEVIEIIGPRYPAIDKRAVQFHEILNAIFEKEHTLSFERYKSLNKKDARAALRELPGMTPYAEAYTLLFGLDSGAAPIDDHMMSVLIDAEAIEEDTTVEDATKFVESHLKAEELYDFFFLVRRAAASRKVKA